VNIVNEKNAGEVARTVKDGCVVGPSTVRRSPSLKEFAVAMAKAQAELKNPTKDAVNPHFKSRYADLATVRDTVMPVLTRHGFSVLQLPCDADDQPALTTLVVHGSGEWVETTMRTRPKGNDPQSVGSALTYARRYSLQSIAGVAAEDDDDGNAASHRPAPQHAQAPPAANADAPDMKAVARFTQAFAQVSDEAGLKRVGDEVVAARLNQATNDLIRKAAVATRERLRPAAKA
jgi:hypothetical protein